MKKLHLFIIKSYLGPFILTFFVAVFFLLMQFLWKYIDDLVGKGLETAIIAELMMYASTTMVPLALPLAILLSSIMTFGNLGERYELVALKSSGVSLQRIMLPLILLSMLICTGAFFFSNNVLPFANLKMSALLHDVRSQRPELSIKEGTFYNGIDNFSIRVARKHMKKNMMYDILIYDHRNRKGNNNVTVADSGVIKISPKKDFLFLTLYHGSSYMEVAEDRKPANLRTFPHRKERFDKQDLSITLIGYNFDKTDESLFKDHYRMLNIFQLDTVIDSLNNAYNYKEASYLDNILKTNYRRVLIQKRENEKEDEKEGDYFVDTTLSFQVDIDSLFKSFPYKEKLRILDLAANYARSSRTYVSSMGEDFLHRKKWIWKHEIALHQKFSLSFACFVLFFIGAPLGAIIRKGGLGMPVVASVIFFIFYYVIDITGEKFVREGVMPAWEGMWLSSVILLPLGLFLTYKATTDSAILDIDSYIKFFMSLFTKQTK